MCSFLIQGNICGVSLPAVLPAADPAGPPSCFCTACGCPVLGGGLLPWPASRLCCSSSVSGDASSSSVKCCAVPPPPPPPPPEEVEDRFGELRLPLPGCSERGDELWAPSLVSPLPGDKRESAAEASEQLDGCR